jgi:hypothetical protein
MIEPPDLFAEARRMTHEIENLEDKIVIAKSVVDRCIALLNSYCPPAVVVSELRALREGALK